MILFKGIYLPSILYFPATDGQEKIDTKPELNSFLSQEARWNWRLKPITIVLFGWEFLTPNGH